MQPTGCCFKLRVAFAVIGIFVGLSIALTFSSVYHNYHTAAWGGVSGLFAAITLFVHLKFKKDRWQNGSKSLLAIIIIGAFIQIGCIAAGATYLALAIVEKQPLNPHGPRAFYLSCVWSFMSWKWSFFMTRYAAIYRRFLSCPLSVRESESLIGHQNA